MTASCVICAREAEHGYLCGDHFAALSSILRDIEDQAAILDARPSMALRVGSGGGGLASETVSARLDVIAFRDPRTRRWEPDTETKPIPPMPRAYGPWCLFCDHQTCTDWRAGRRRDLHNDEYDAGSATLASVLDEMHNWARLVREERQLSDPKSVTVSGERDLLTRQLEWCAAQPWIDEMHGDLRKLLGQLRTINRTQGDRPEGVCQLPTDTGICGGNIWRREQRRVTWRVKPDRCDLEPVKAPDGPAYCEHCGAEWDDGVELDRLRLILEQAKSEATRPKTSDGRRMLTAQELVDEGIVSSVSNVRVTAHRRGIRAVNGHYDPDVFRERACA